MYRSICFGLLAMLGVVSTWSQEMPRPGVLPASPTAASLGVYGEYPVNYGSGLPSINIPLLAVKGSTMSVPISLSYHGGGIRVDDISSWAGLGWSLNAGGVITRTLHGNEDGASLGIRNTLSEGLDPDTFNPEFDEDHFEVFQNIAKRGWTADPDIYSFNFLGYSGQFYYDLNGSIHLVSAENIDIREISGGYEISVGDGRVFTFTEEEETSTTNSSNCSDEESALNYTSAWYLKTITSDWETFTFNYSNETLLYPINRTEQKTKVAPNQFDCIGETTCHFYSTMGVTRKRLTSIVGPFETAIFTVNPSIETAAGAKVLSSIAYENITANFNFLQVTSTGTSWQGNTTSVRPFLNSVTLSAASEDDQVWSFGYDPVTLPNRLSYKVDHYGFFNGQSNLTYFPSVAPHWTAGGANREPVPSNAKAGSLREITYPTGGMSRFDWESNSYQVLENSEVEILFNYTEGTMPTEFTYTETITLARDQSISIDYDIGNATGTGSGGEGGEVTISGLDSFYQHLSGVGTTSSGTIPAGDYTVSIVNNGPPIDGVVVRFHYIAESTPELVTKYTGGLRIGSIENFEEIGDATPATKKIFEYPEISVNNEILPSEYTGMSHSILAGTTMPLGSSSQIPVVTGDCDFLRITTQPQMTKPSTMNYRRVIEKSVVGTTDNGHVEYKYLTVSDDGGGVLNTPLHDRSWVRGMLEEKRTVARNGSLVELLVNDYDLNSEYVLAGLKAGYIIDDPTYEDFPPNPDELLSYRSYYRHSEWARLNNTTTTRYFATGDNSITTSFTYYRPTTHRYANEVTTEGSDGVIRKTIILYPKDFTTNSSIPTSLKSNYFGRPIEQVNLIGGKAVSAIVASYSVEGELLNNWVLETNSSISSYVFANGSTDASDKAPFELRNHYTPEVQLDYSSFIGQVREKIDRAFPSAYLWSYNNSLILANFSGFTFSELTTYYNGLVTSQGLPNLTSLGVETNNTTLSSILETLREHLPKGVLMTGYLHDPGIGIKAQLSAQGQWNSYEYDNFNRLYQIKDQDQNVLKEYQYNYSN